VGNLRYADGCPGTAAGFLQDSNQPVVVISSICATTGAQRFDLTLPADAELPPGAQLWLGRLALLPATIDDSQPAFVAITQARPPLAGCVAALL
jgi:hypothetical protein